MAYRMPRRLVGLALLFLLGAATLTPAAPATPTAPPQPQPGVQANTITYELIPHLEMTPRRLEVQMVFAVTGQPEQVSVQMPVWSPGDYRVQNHARYVADLVAWDLSTPHSDPPRLRMTHPDQNTWQITPAGATEIGLTYTLPQTPPGLFSENVQLQARQVFVNGPAAYLYVVGRKDAPALLKLKPPAGWNVEISLPPGPKTDDGLVAYTAPDYDTLADSPLVMAAENAMTVRTFTLNGVPHRIVFFGRQERIRDKDVYTPVLSKVAQAESQIMGGTPCARYDFLFDVDGAGGGLEHLNACRIALSDSLSTSQAAPFVAHEYFHLWNVKRIRPRVLGPFDYIHPPRTRNLWFAEGVTEYYAHLATCRASLSTPQQFFSHYRNAIDDLQQNPARRQVTADESSLRVWEAGDSEGFGGLSYYNKGELIGLCMDLTLRHVTGNRRSLDDMMRLLMQRHNPPRPGYGEDELRDVLSEVAGQDLSAFYDLLARSTQEMPFAECLSYAGLSADLSPLPNATPEQVALRTSWLTGKAEALAPSARR